MKTYIVTDNSGIIKRSGTCKDIDVVNQFTIPLLGFTIPNDTFTEQFVNDIIWHVDLARNVLVSSGGDGATVTPVI